MSPPANPTPAPAQSTAANNNPAPQVATSDPPPSCGKTIDTLAAAHRVHPYDMLAMLAGVLGNVAGPHAGFVTPDNTLVRPSSNLLLLDCNGAAVRDLEHALLQPLRARADLIRQRATSISRHVADQWAFGTDGKNPGKKLNLTQQHWLKAHQIEQLAHQKRLVESGDIPLETFDYLTLANSGAFPMPGPTWMDTSPGIHFLPTLYADRYELTQVPKLLEESFQREAFLCHPVGGMFSQGNIFSAKMERLAEQLSQWLHGCDMQFPPVHKNQGHGTFASARVGIWSATDSARIGAILNNTGSQWNEVLRQCLLWSKSTYVGQVPTTEQAEEAHWAYQRTLHGQLDIRCNGKYIEQPRLILPPLNIQAYAKGKRLYQDCLDRTSATNRPYVMQFHNLPERLMWVLMQFSKIYEPCVRLLGSDIAIISIAFVASIHIAKMQCANLTKLRKQAVEQKQSSTAEHLKRVLHRRGPLLFRELQRATNNLRKSELMPGIELLMQRGQVRHDAHQRYSLVPTESTTPTSVTFSSNTSVQLPS